MDKDTRREDEKTVNFIELENIPPMTICFNNECEIVGKLSFDIEANKVTFSGDYDKSAKIFADAAMENIQFNIKERERKLEERVKELESDIGQIGSNSVKHIGEAITAQRKVSEFESTIAEMEHRYEEYIKLLVEELRDCADIARVHGWKSTRYEAGVEARKAIEALRIAKGA
jgi:hypothetical protein